MNRIPLAVICIFFAIITIITAEDFITLDGEKYEGVTLKRIEPDGLVICYSDGVKKLKFNNLPPEVCSKYGYNRESEAQFLQQLKAQEITSFNNAAQAREEKAKKLSTALEHQTILIPQTSVSSIREQLKTAEWNRDFLQHRIREDESFLRAYLIKHTIKHDESLVRESDQENSEINRLRERLAKHKEELVQKQNKVALAQAELVRATTPPPVDSPHPTLATATTPPPVAVPTVNASSAGFIQRLKNYVVLLSTNPSSSIEGKLPIFSSVYLIVGIIVLALLVAFLRKSKKP
jgi:hypothetical protein